MHGSAEDVRSDKNAIVNDPRTLYSHVAGPNDIEYDIPFVTLFLVVGWSLRIGNTTDSTFKLKSALMPLPSVHEQ